MASNVFETVGVCRKIEMLVDNRKDINEGIKKLVHRLLTVYVLAKPFEECSLIAAIGKDVWVVVAGYNGDKALEDAFLLVFVVGPE
jgi:hypothetical protein